MSQSALKPIKYELVLGFCFVKLKNTVSFWSIYGDTFGQIVQVYGTQY